MRVPTGAELRALRRQRKWTQGEVAHRLGVSQSYVSLLERGQRRWTPSLLAKILRYADVPPESRPLGEPDGWLECADVNDRLARELGGLGYPGFAYLRSRARTNPAELLVGALLQRDLEARVTEALPWLVAAYPGMDWPWVVSQAKLHDLQNRLGFVLSLARQVAEEKANQDLERLLAERETSLEPSRLEHEGTLCRDFLTQAERRWLREHRSPEAKKWRLLTDLAPEHLSHAA